MDEKMMMTYLFTDLFCIIMALTMSISFKEDFGSAFEIKSIRKSVYSFCGFLICGLVWLFMENGYLPMLVWVVWLSNMLSLLLLIAVSYFWFKFALSRVNRELISNKIIVIFSDIPMVIALLMCATTPITGWVFNVSIDGIYSRGPLLVFFSSLGYAYDFAVFIVAMFGAFKEKQKEQRNICFVIAAYIIFPLAASILQLKYSGMPIIAPAIVTGYFLVYNMIRSTQVYNDALTGLNNRRSSMRYLNEHMHTNYACRPITLYMIDFNSFKQINDTYGHLEGDRALKALATSLNSIAVEKNVFASRYGGDEFMIISNESEIDSMQGMVNLVRERLKRQSDEMKLPYLLTVSIGYAFTYDKSISAEELIKMADQELYKDKLAFHKKC